MKWYPSRKAAHILGVHPNTLRRWADKGKIAHIRTDAGQRLYDVDSFIGKSGQRIGVCYCRVSSVEQKDDLERQIEFMRARFPDYQIVSDIGSGLNYQRKGLNSLLGRLLDREKLHLVVARRDRLARFGVELIKYLVEFNGGELLILDCPVRSAEQEITEDLLAILNGFSDRMRDRQVDKVTEDSAVSYDRTAPAIQTLIRCIETAILRSS